MIQSVSYGDILIFMSDKEEWILSVTDSSKEGEISG